MPRKAKTAATAAPEDLVGDLEAAPLELNDAPEGNSEAAEQAPGAEGTEAPAAAAPAFIGLDLAAGPDVAVEFDTINVPAPPGGVLQPAERTLDEALAGAEPERIDVVGIGLEVAARIAEKKAAKLPPLPNPPSKLHRRERERLLAELAEKGE